MAREVEPDGPELRVRQVAVVPPHFEEERDRIGLEPVRERKIQEAVARTGRRLLSLFAFAHADSLSFKSRESPLHSNRERLVELRDFLARKNDVASRRR